MAARRKSNRASAKPSNQKYAVNVSMKAWDIAKVGAAVTLKVKDRGRVLGTMEIGQGSFRWKGAHARSFKRIPWSRFAAALDEL